jgi:hypothetical protein
LVWTRLGWVLYVVEAVVIGRGQRAKEKAVDISEDGGAARGDTVLHSTDKPLLVIPTGITRFFLAHALRLNPTFKEDACRVTEWRDLSSIFGYLSHHNNPVILLLAPLHALSSRVTSRGICFSLG